MAVGGSLIIILKSNGVNFILKNQKMS